MTLRKALRTAQNLFPWAGEAKNIAYHFARTRLGTVHDSSFRALALLPRRERELFLDIGGNRGQSIIAMRRFRPGVPIVSFEPNPAMFAWLQRRFGRLPGLELRRLALGARPGSVTLHIPSYGGFEYDGLATTEASKARAFFSDETLYFYDPDKVSVATHCVPQVTLDSLGLAPSFVKIDVEGGELAVLRGATETLRRHRPVLMLERWYADAGIAPLLGRLGYREVTPSADGFVPGTSDGLNAFWAAG